MSAWEVGKYSYINVHLPDEGTRRTRTRLRWVNASCHLDQLRAKAPQHIRTSIHSVKTSFAATHQHLPVPVQRNYKSPQKVFTHNSSTPERKWEKVLGLPLLHSNLLQLKRAGFHKHDEFLKCKVFKKINCTKWVFCVINSFQLWLHEYYKRY